MPTRYRLVQKMAQYFRFSSIFALLLLSNLHLQAYSIPEIVAAIKPAIVQIIAFNRSGSVLKAGKGFFISPNGFAAVTNFHVIQGASSLAARNIPGAV